MTIGELVVDLVFKSETKTLQDFIHDLGDLNLKSIFATGALGGLYEGVKKIMEAADQTATALNNMMNITGVSAKTFQQWDNVAQQFGVTAGATSQAISGIQSSIFELIRSGTGNGQMINQLLGVDPRGFVGHPEELLKQELSFLEQFDKPTRRFYAQMLGISDEMLLLVGHTKEIDEALANQESELSTIAQWHRIINKLAGDIRVIFVTIGAVLGPIIEPFVQGITTMLELVEKLSQAFSGVIQAMLVIASIAAVIGGIINPWIAGIAILVSGIGFISDKLHISDILTPNRSQFGGGDNNQNVSVDNTYNINGGNPQDVTNAIRKHWEQTTINSDLQTSSQY